MSETDRLREELREAREFALKLADKLYLCFEILQRLAEKREPEESP